MSNCNASAFPELAQLLAANEKWANGVSAADPHFFANGAKGQAPKVLWLGCADSRVPESVIMACPPGTVFVHRNIANQFHPGDDNAQAVLAYAVEHLHVEHVVVAGHTLCGGAEAAFKSAKAGAHAHAPATPLERWLAPLTQLVRALPLGAKEMAEAVPYIVDASVTAQVENIAKTETICAAWRAGKAVYVHGWVYHVGVGLLQDLKVSRGPLCK